VMLFPKGAL